MTFPPIEQSALVGPILLVDGKPVSPVNVGNSGAEDPRRAAVTHSDVEPGGAPGSAVRGATSTSAVRCPDVTELTDSDWYAVAVPFGRRCDTQCGAPLGEIFELGSFTTDLSTRERPLDVPVVVGHTTEVVGRVLEAIEAPSVGLVAWIRLVDSAAGWAAQDLLDAGHRACSIGFAPITSRQGKWAERTITAAHFNHLGLGLRIWDGAYPEARVYPSLTELYEAARTWPAQGLHPLVEAGVAETRAQQARRAFRRRVESGELTTAQALALI